MWSSICGDNLPSFHFINARGPYIHRPKKKKTALVINNYLMTMVLKLISIHCAECSITTCCSEAVIRLLWHADAMPFCSLIFYYPVLIWWYRRVTNTDSKVPTIIHMYMHTSNRKWIHFSDITSSALDCADHRTSEGFCEFVPCPQNCPIRGHVHCFGASFNEPGHRYVHGFMHHQQTEKTKVWNNTRLLFMTCTRERLSFIVPVFD